MFASEMEEKEKEFLQKSLDIFTRFGIKSVTMADMARHLGCSKKTIYNFVKDKNDLVRSCLSLHTCIEQDAIEGICSQDQNAIDEMFQIGSFISTMLKEMHPSIQYDLEKYHSEVYAEMKEEHHEHVYECMLRNLNKGIKEGLYREDLNAAVIAKLYVKKMDILFDVEVFPRSEFSFKEVYAVLFRYHILGVASPKGAKYLAKKFENLKSNTL